jgi:hypothetical protein
LIHNACRQIHLTTEQDPTSPLQMPLDKQNPSVISVDGEYLDLRNRPLAALLAWLIPGAGHFYQRRYAKSGIFFICIMSLWIIGFVLGGSHVVYASWQPGDKRWHYLLQAGAGVIALPALVQGKQMNDQTEFGRTERSYAPRWGGFMAPPFRPVIESEADEVSAWYANKGAGYEMGTWYTVIAGLLNILVIYDAYGGPLAVPISGRRKATEHEGDSSEPESEATAAAANNAANA